MKHHRALAVLVCCALLLARGHGLHAHIETHPEGPDAATLDAHSHDGGEAHSAIVAVGDADHMGRHLGHGDVDVDLPDLTSGKLPSMPWAPMALAVALAVLLPGAGLRLSRAVLRPPPRRRGRHLLPPSQAPPFAR